MMRALAASVAAGWRRAAVPLIWYYAIAVAVPLANGAAFGEHMVFVIVVPPVFISVVWSVKALAVRAIHP